MPLALEVLVPVGGEEPGEGAGVALQLAREDAADQAALGEPVGSLVAQ